METAARLSYKDLADGMACDRGYVVTPAVYENFQRAFADRNPLHVDAEYARSLGFDGPVMHGAILNGFVSHFVGMVFPGAHSLLLSTELRFSEPVYLGDAVRLYARVAQRVDAQQVVVLHVTVVNETRGGTTATGRLQVRVTDA
ncbi:unnamed protein product [uncultured bacterium]|nr:unnamed protein product [uncultured bacterium]